MSVEAPVIPQKQELAEQAVINEAENIVSSAATAELKPEIGETMAQFQERKRQVEGQVDKVATSATIKDLENQIMNGDRLTSLRSTYQSEIAAGKTEADAMESATKLLSEDKEVASLLPNDKTTEQFNDDADRLFQDAEKVMRMPENEYKAYIKSLDGVNDNGEAIRDFEKVDLKTYSNGAKHVYGTDRDGTKVHLSHDGVLEAYGYSASEVKEAKTKHAEEKARDEAIVAAAAAKATPQMVKTAKAMMAPQAKEQPKQKGVYGYKGADLVNNGIDIVGPNPTREAVLVSGKPEDGYDGPVTPGMEVELAPKTDVVPFEGSDNLPVIVGETGDNLPVLATSNEIEPTTAEEIDEAVESQGKLSVRDRLRNRWNDLRVRGTLLAQGDIRGALGDTEGKLVNKKRMLGAAVVAGAGVLVWMNNKHGWGIDINPLDGDGFDLNPFNNHEQTVTEAAGAAPLPSPEVVTPEGWTDTVNQGDGLTNSIMDYGTQHNVPVSPERAFEVFNQLKVEGLIDQATVTGSTPMDVIGNIGYSGQGSSTWSPEVVERMNQLLGIAS